MEAKLCFAEEEKERLSERLNRLSTELQSMVPEIHGLSIAPGNIAELNKYIVSKYHPVLFAQVALPAKIDAQSKLIEDMRKAMLEQQYIEDREEHAWQRFERNCLEVEMILVEAEMILENKLVEDASQNLNEAEIRGKINNVSVYPWDLMERSSEIKEGDIAGVQIYTGPRSMAVNWCAACVVVKRVTQGYVVCLFAEYSDCLHCRFVEEADILGPPKEGFA